MEYIGVKQAVKDGYIKMKIGGVADFNYPTSKVRRGRVQGDGDICPTITAMNMEAARVMDKEKMMYVDEEGNNRIKGKEYKEMKEQDFEKAEKCATSEVPPKIEDYLYKDFGVFKLTERECGRLMGVRDSDIDKMKTVVSKSQMYKQFGNSIVVPVLMAIFSQLNIQDITPWNELNQKQREDLIERTTV